MANTKISALTDGTTAQASDAIPIARSGANYYITPSYLKTYLGLSVASGKTFTASNTLTLAGTDGTTMTFPSTSATIARTDAGNTFTGNQVVSSGSFGLSGNISVSAWTTNGVRYKNVAATLTDTSSSGTVATAYTDVFGGNTIAASSATTFTNYYTAFISGPTAGTNVTFTAKWAMGLSGSLSVTGQIVTPTQTLTDGTNIAWDVDASAIAKVTLGGNRTLSAPTNLRDGGTYVLRVIQDGTGNRTLAYNSVFKWPGGVAPVLSTGANAIDILTFVSDGTNLYGSIQQAFA